MKRNRFFPYLVISVFFHGGILLLCHQYGLMIGEEPGRLLPVAVMVIKDIPPVSLPPPARVSEPRALAGRPPPVAPRPDLTPEAPEPVFVDAPMAPRLTLSPRLTSRPSETHRRTEAVAMAGGSGGEEAVVYTVPTSVDLLIPDASPAIAMEPAEGRVPVTVGQREARAIPARAALRSARPVAVADPPDVVPPSVASLEPPLLAPVDEPVDLKFERPPTLPFPGTTQGASFLLLVDTSGSVKGDPLKGIKASAVDFVSLMGPKDSVALMTFDATTRLLNPFISIPFEKDLLKIRLRQLGATGKLTVLNDALLEAGQILNTEDSEQLHIVLFSDGKDEGSRATLRQAISSLKGIKISVLAVGYTRVEERYMNVLRRIADETGGVFVQTPEFRDILALYKSASQETASAAEAVAPAGGALLISSDPTGVRIYLNGEYVGATPKRVELPMGDYRLQLKNDGYHEWQAQVHLSEPGEMPVFIQLEPLHR